MARTTDLASWHATASAGERLGERRRRSARSTRPGGHLVAVGQATAQPSSDSARATRVGARQAHRQVLRRGRRRRGTARVVAAAAAPGPRRRRRAPPAGAAGSRTRTARTSRAGCSMRSGPKSSGGTSSRSSSTGASVSITARSRVLRASSACSVEGLARAWASAPTRGPGSRRGCRTSAAAGTRPSRRCPGTPGQVVAGVARPCPGSRSSAPARCRTARAPRRACTGWCR